MESIKKEDRKEFVPLKDIMVTDFENPESCKVVLDFHHGGDIQLEIEDGEVEEFYLNGGSFDLGWLSEVERDRDILGSIKLLKVTVGMYALGVDEYKKAVESGQILLPKKK